jgi:hypothetical protein
VQGIDSPLWLLDCIISRLNRADTAVTGGAGQDRAGENFNCPFCAQDPAPPYSGAKTPCSASSHTGEPARANNEIHSCGNGCVYQMRKCKIWDLVKMNSPIASYTLCLAGHCHGDTCHIFSTGGHGIIANIRYRSTFPLHVSFRGDFRALS